MTQMTSKVTTVTDQNFASEVLEADRPVVVDFWAAWCGPCRIMSPVIEELASEREDLRFAKLDADANPDTCARYGVLSMPTFMVFRGGEPVGQLVGSRPASRLRAELEEILS